MWRTGQLVSAMQIQEAFEHLSDAQKRREFDSVDEFDDSLPESCASEDFFRVRKPQCEAGLV